MAWFTYLIQVSVCLAAFYLLYVFLLRNITFFALNRYYLLVGLIASFVIPSLNFSLPSPQYNTLLDHTILVPWSEPDTDSTSGINNNPLSPPADYQHWIISIYGVGILVAVLRFILSTARVAQVLKKGDAASANGLSIIRADIGQPFAFFHLIALPKYGVDDLVLNHEAVHVKQLHWIDLILLETATVLLWFNPVIYLYRRAAKTQHEYLADHHVLSCGATIEQYLNCLVAQIYQENSSGTISQFYSQSIKTRIHMITKSKSSGKVSAVYLLLIPITSILLFSFSFKPLIQTKVKTTVIVATDNRPDIAPVEMSKARISSTYGIRINPYTHKKQFHTGVDLEMAQGENVMATASGVVTVAAFDKNKGNYIVVKHDDTYSTEYFHLHTALMKAGDKVEKSQIIGTVGSTGGLSTAPHLHYEVTKQGKNVDPMDYLPVTR